MQTTIESINTTNTPLTNTFFNSQNFSTRKLLFGGYRLSNNDTITAQLSRSERLINMQLSISSADDLNSGSDQEKAFLEALKSCEQSEIMIRFQPQNKQDLVKLQSTITKLQELLLPEEPKPSFRIHIDRKRLTTAHAETDTAFSKFFGLTQNDKWLKGYIAQINKQAINADSAVLISRLSAFVKVDYQTHGNKPSSARINISIKNTSPEPVQKSEPEDAFYQYLQEQLNVEPSSATYSSTKNNLFSFLGYSEQVSIGDDITVSTQRSRNNSLKSVTITHKETAAINKNLLSSAFQSFNNPKATIKFKPTNTNNLDKLRDAIQNLGSKTQLNIKIDASELINNNPMLQTAIMHHVRDLNDAKNTARALSALAKISETINPPPPRPLKSAEHSINSAEFESRVTTPALERRHSFNVFEHQLELNSADTSRETRLRQKSF